MKKIFLILVLMLAITQPAFAQSGQRRLSPDDQRRFDSYYQRWQQYRQTNNRSEMFSMEKRMQDIYQHYGIPANTPYGRVASDGGGGYGDRGRDWDRGNNYRERFSPARRGFHFRPRTPCDCRTRHAHAPRRIPRNRRHRSHRFRQLALGAQPHYWIHAGNVTLSEVPHSLHTSNFRERKK